MFRTISNIFLFERVLGITGTHTVSYKKKQNKTTTTTKEIKEINALDFVKIQHPRFL